MQLKNNLFVNFESDATKIANRFKKFKNTVDNKPVNDFGYKELQYTNNNPEHSKKYYLNPETKKIVYMPKEDPVSPKHGAFKTVIKEDYKMLGLEFESPQKLAYTPNEIAKIFNKLNIKNFQPIYQTEKQLFITNNRGTTLNKRLKDKKFPLTNFKNILLDIKKLHIEGYFYRDFKPKNIVEDRLGKLWVIDTESLIRKESPNIKQIYTRMYTTNALLEEIYSNKNYDLLKTADDYALAITLLETNSEFFRAPYLQAANNNDSILTLLESDNGFVKTYMNYYFKEQGGIKINFEIIKWINEHIKNGYKTKFLLLLANPLKYYNKFKANDHLVDMINFNYLVYRKNAKNMRGLLNKY